MGIEQSVSSGGKLYDDDSTRERGSAVANAERRALEKTRRSQETHKTPEPRVGKVSNILPLGLPHSIDNLGEDLELLEVTSLGDLAVCKRWRRGESASEGEKNGFRVVTNPDLLLL